MSRVCLIATFAVLGVLAVPGLASAGQGNATGPTSADSASANPAWGGASALANETTPTFSNDVGAPSSGAGPQLSLALALLGLGVAAIGYGLFAMSARTRRDEATERRPLSRRATLRPMSTRTG